MKIWLLGIHDIVRPLGERTHWIVAGLDPTRNRVHITRSPSLQDPRIVSADEIILVAKYDDSHMMRLPFSARLIP